MFVFFLLILEKVETEPTKKTDRILISNTIKKNYNYNMENSTIKEGFPIPLWAGWVVNIIGWVLFVSTMNHVLEIITALLCIGCVYVAYKHKQAGTSPFLGMDRLSANNLIYASAFEAVWMLGWGLGLFGELF